MTKDHSRDHLVMKLLCIKCGSLLKMSYDKPEKSSYDTEVEGITGADKVVSNISVYPCNCSLVHQRKLESIREALS